MLSFASVAVDGYSRTIWGNFTANLETLPGCSPDPATKLFWESNPEAYAATRENLMSPEQAMWAYRSWVESIAKRNNLKPVRVGFPILFDGMWERWYLVKFTGGDPFSYSGIDMKTMGMTLLNKPYTEINKRLLKANWPTKRPHTHVALDDALEQADIFLGMLNQIQHTV